MREKEFTDMRILILILLSLLFLFLTASQGATGEDAGQIQASPGQAVDDTLLLDFRSDVFYLVVPGDVEWPLQMPLEMHPEEGFNKKDMQLLIESRSKWQVDVVDAGPTEKNKWHLRAADGSTALHYRLNITNLDDPLLAVPFNPLDSANPSTTIAEGEPTSGTKMIHIELRQTSYEGDDVDASYQIVLRFTATQVT